MDKEETINMSFFSFLKAKEQRVDWLILLLSCIAGYIILKICYPYPATISDSGTYVQAAMSDMFSFYRPFGYSYFLQLVHALSPSIHAVFIVQMILYFFASASFAFVIKSLYPPANRIFWQILLFLFVFSPISFYMANSIMSDLLFAVIVYFMLAAFLYLFKRPNWISLFVFVLSLYFALHIRYSAMMFPILFIVGFLLMKNKFYWIGIVCTLAVSFLFYNQVKADMRKVTGFNQFSTGFDGWQLANNAIHIVPYIDLDYRLLPEDEMKILHQFVVAQEDVIREKTNNGTKTSASFMWINDEPLKQFLFACMEYTGESYPTCWIKLGSDYYKDYGKYLIKKYPLKFLQYYYLPNAKSIFYVDSKEMIGSYTRIDRKDIFDWYHIPTKANVNARHTIYESFVSEASAVSYIPIWIVILIGTVLSVVLRRKLKWDGKDSRTIFWIIVAIGVLYYGVTVFASPVSLRFWLPMNAVLFAVIYILYNRLIIYRKNKLTQ